MGKFGERVARNISIFDFAYVDILDYSEAYVDFSLCTWDYLDYSEAYVDFLLCTCDFDYFNYSNDAYVDYLVEYLGYRFFVSGPDGKKKADFGPSQTIQ